MRSSPSTRPASRPAFDLDAIGPPSRTWIDYVAGTAWALGEAGLALRGFRGLLASTVPQGAGLSSSAALEMASALALLGPASTVPGRRRATLGQRAENGYVGVQSGVMDQFASAAGVAGQAILLDCRSLDVRHVPLPRRAPARHLPQRLVAQAGDIGVQPAPGGVRPGRREIRRLDPTVTALRDVTPELLAAAEPRMDEIAARRARHVVEEDLRVHEAELALAGGDLAEVGRLFAASHASLRDLYEVSSPELDALVEIATAVPGSSQPV